MDIIITYDDREVRQELIRLQQASNNMSPAMRQIANHLQASAERSFKLQANPATGAPWAPLSKTTVARRKKIGKGPTPILEQSGDLRRSIHDEHGKDHAIAGTNLIYAATHQFGAKQGQFAVKKGRPIPWGDIPARPFLGLRKQEHSQILNSIINHLRGRR